MARFDAAIKTAQKLIAKNGEKVVWNVSPDPTPTDPNKPWKPGPAQADPKDVVICFLPVDRQTQESFNFVNGTEVPKGSVMGLMGGVDFEPNLKDTVTRNGVELRLAYIDVLSPNGQKVLYTMVFKQ